MYDHQSIFRVLRTVMFLLYLLFEMTALSVTAGESSPCDPRLTGSSPNALSYQFRGDSCEGLYASNSRFRMLTGTLRVVSFVERFDDFDLDSGQKLMVDWSVPQPRDVFLQAQSLQAGLYYRMDTKRQADESRYVWPLTILRQLSISRNNLGVLGWASYKLSNGMVKDVYLPLRISQNPSTETSSPAYQLVIWPTQELSEVYVSVATLDADGSPKAFILDGKALGYGYYPENRGIHFEIPKPSVPGIYYLQIGAVFVKGGVVNVEYWFYHKG
ncbi:hypothetical protein CSA57_11040 [candidate division KSB3 bacterium]|nr:MAG: hypothetical protein CSA57_11040 [candidate division KSB3 bacterium]